MDVAETGVVIVRFDVIPTFYDGLDYVDIRNLKKKLSIVPDSRKTLSTRRTTPDLRCGQPILFLES